jgi:hypothetical protein
MSCAIAFELLVREPVAVAANQGFPPLYLSANPRRRFSIRCFTAERRTFCGDSAAR